MTKKKRTTRSASASTKAKPKPEQTTSKTLDGDAARAVKTAGRKKTKTRSIEIKDEKTLGALGPQLNRLLNAKPGLAAMLFINPVLAMKEAGVKLSRPVVHHILSRLRHRPAMRERREELEAHLTKALCEVPRPNNSAWLSRTLFEKLHLPPLDTGDLTPSYKSAHDPAVEKRLQALRPKRTHRYPHLPSRPRRTGRVRMQEMPPSVRRIDLEATVPELKPAKRTPKRLSLEDLYFYKDSSPVARDLLELAIIQRRGLRLHSRYSYRLIKEGKRGNVFRRWFRKVTLPEPEVKE
ncbi:MAG TPA: hypothetical protein ENH21_03160 [Chromatiales bacterium]|nr:hypothetical protein [Chromatiales bacterium]HEX22409.1 hypothetical protein [Chromatiales bacterium]